MEPAHCESTGKTHPWMEAEPSSTYVGTWFCSCEADSIEGATGADNTAVANTWTPFTGSGTEIATTMKELKAVNTVVNEMEAAETMVNDTEHPNETLGNKTDNAKRAQRQGPIPPKEGDDNMRTEDEELRTEGEELQVGTRNEDAVAKVHVGARRPPKEDDDKMRTWDEELRTEDLKEQGEEDREEGGHARTPLQDQRSCLARKNPRAKDGCPNGEARG